MTHAGHRAYKKVIKSPGDLHVKQVPVPHVSDKVEFDNLVLVDSQQCFMIDESIEEKIVTLRDYEKNLRIP